MIDTRCILLSIVVAFLYSIGWVVSKYLLIDFPPILLAAFRFGVVAAFLVWFAKPPWRQMREIAFISTLVVVIPFSTAYSGLQSLDVSITVIIAHLDGPVVIILSAMLLGERPNYFQIFGTILAFTGAVVILLTPSVFGNYFEAFLIFTSVIAWGFGQIRIRRMKSIEPFSQIVWISVFATPQLIFISAIFDRDQIRSIQDASWAVWSSILFLGLFITPVSITLWYKIVRKYSFSSTAPFLLLVPVLSILAGIVFFGEDLTFRFFIGASIVLLGLVSIMIEPRSKHVGERRRITVA